MCGIVYYKSFINKNVNKKVLRQFKAQRSRGTSGFGFYIPEANRLTHNERETRIKRLLKRDKATEVLFHHRFPTSTANVRNACHPFSTKDTFKHNYVLVHNGIIWNDQELQADHAKLGIKYVSAQPDGRFNDSEALLYDIALYLEGEQTKLKAEGDIAFIVIENDEAGKPIKLHFGRNTGNPLMMEFGEDALSLSSEGAGVNIVPNQLYTFSYETCELDLTALEIPEYHWVSTYNGNSGFGGSRARSGIGFQPSGTDPWGQPTKYRDEIWDEATRSWRNSSDPIFDSVSYYETLYLQGQNLATELWAEFHSLDLALDAANDELDSVRGKLMQIGGQLNAARPNSKRARRFRKEKETLMMREDVLIECIDAFNEFTADDFTAKLEQASKKAEEAHIDGTTATA